MLFSISNTVTKSLGENRFWDLSRSHQNIKVQKDNALGVHGNHVYLGESQLILFVAVALAMTIGCTKRTFLKCLSAASGVLDSDCANALSLVKSITRLATAGQNFCRQCSSRSALLYI